MPSFHIIHFLFQRVMVVKVVERKFGHEGILAYNQYVSKQLSLWKKKGETDYKLDQMGIYHHIEPSKYNYSIGRTS